jgi:EpsD family peptidyl-prolyl cis-trans isomerase
MTLTSSLPRAAGRHSGTSRVAIFALAALALALVGCGDRKKDVAASQTAARINAEEVTVHQINMMLRQQRGLKPDQVDAASKQILELLVDQELAVQRARELKIDQDPRVMLQVEGAKREALARAYVERIADAAPKPTPEAIKKYYNDRPELFKDRRIYSLQELAIEAKPEQVALLRGQLQRAKSATEFVEYLKANDFRFNGNQAMRAAEQLPADALEHVVKLKNGQMVLLPSPTGGVVIMLLGSRSEPVDESRAAPAIEQFLFNVAKRKVVEADVKAMRAGAKIEFVGKFASNAASAPPPGQPQVESAASAAGGMSAEAIRKGMGIKQ